MRSQYQWPDLLLNNDAHRVLGRLISTFARDVRLEPLGQYRDMTLDAIWRVLVGQVCVMGSARLMERLDATQRTEFEDATSLRIVKKETNRERYLARVLRHFSATRFPEKAARKLEHLLAAKTAFSKGKLFSDLSHDEKFPGKTREKLMERCAMFGLKSASDFMISVGLSHNVVALDTRVVGVLRKWCNFTYPIGRIQSSPRRYASLEAELRALCEKSNTSLAVLDRLLFKFSSMSAVDWVLSSR